jgi:predicted acetyltransferase
MTLEIRPYRPEEYDAFNRVPAIVFGNYTGIPRSQVPPEQRGPDIIPPEISLCAFEDGTLASTYAAYPFVMRLNGAKAPAAGVTCVGTLPEFRRRGHLRRIMEHDFKRRYEERMEPLAILLASIAGIYQRYGYAVCSSRYSYTIDPRMIAFAPSIPAATGTWREAPKDELPLLQAMYRQFSQPRNGYLHRAPVVWEAQVLGLSPGFSDGYGPSLVAVYEEAGEPRGYVAYAAKGLNDAPDGAGPGQRVFVRDYVWHTPSAYCAMWEFLKKFDLAKRILVPAAPVDDPAFDIMLDPRELDATRFDHLLARIIDVERVLPLRPYGEGRVVFELRDELCPWNRGRWALEAGPEGAAISRSGETASLALDVSALAQLVFGQVAPSRAVRYGRAEASADAPLALWDAMFRTEYAPFCPDGF